MQLDLDSFEHSKPRGALIFCFYAWDGDTVTIHKRGRDWPEGVLEALKNAALRYPSWLRFDMVIDEFVQLRSSQPVLKVAEAIAAQIESKGITVKRIIYSSPSRKYETSTFY